MRTNTVADGAADVSHLLMISRIAPAEGQAKCAVAALQKLRLRAHMPEARACEQGCI